MIALSLLFLTGLVVSPFLVAGCKLLSFNGTHKYVSQFVQDALKKPSVKQSIMTADSRITALKHAYATCRKSAVAIVLIASFFHVLRLSFGESLAMG